jgi:Cu+-exporting ATPase
MKQMIMDLVCNMEVDEKTAPAKSDYKGKTYYFCAPGCKKEFDKNPEKYIGKAPKSSGCGH